MKTHLRGIIFPVCLGLLIASAAVADVDGSTPLTCAVAEVYECNLDDGCMDLSADTIEVPALFHIDFTRGEIAGVLDDGSERKSVARHKEILETKLVMQGVEQGWEGERDGSAWSLTITQDTAEMALTSSADETAFVILGSCEADR
jgi:hypothetical protein